MNKNYHHYYYYYYIYIHTYIYIHRYARALITLVRSYIDRDDVHTRIHTHAYAYTIHTRIHTNRHTCNHTTHTPIHTSHHTPHTSHHTPHTSHHTIHTTHLTHMTCYNMPYIWKAGSYVYYYYVQVLTIVYSIEIVHGSYGMFVRKWLFQYLIMVTGKYLNVESKLYVFAFPIPDR